MGIWKHKAEDGAQEPRETTEEPETRLRAYSDADLTRAQRRVLERERRERRRSEVKLFTLDYNATTEEYLLHESRVPFDDLPPGAVHITGRKKEYLWDRVRVERRDGGMTAADLCLWMVNNSINDALAVSWKTATPDIKKYIIYGIAGIILVCVVWAMM